MNRCPMCNADLPPQAERCNGCGASIEYNDTSEQSRGEFRRVNVIKAKMTKPLSADLSSIPPEMQKEHSFSAGIRIVRDDKGNRVIFARDATGQETQYNSPEQLPPGARQMYERMQQMAAGRSGTIPDLPHNLGDQIVLQRARVSRGSRFAAAVFIFIFGLLLAGAIIAYGVNGIITGHMLVPRGPRFSGRMSGIGGNAAYALAVATILFGLWLHFGLFWKSFSLTRTLADYAQKFFLVSALMAFAVFAYFLIF